MRGTHLSPICISWRHMWYWQPWYYEPWSNAQWHSVLRFSFSGTAFVISSIGTTNLDPMRRDAFASDLPFPCATFDIAANPDIMLIDAFASNLHFLAPHLILATLVQRTWIQCAGTHLPPICIFCRHIWYWQNWQHWHNEHWLHAQWHICQRFVFLGATFDTGQWISGHQRCLMIQS